MRERSGFQRLPTWFYVIGLATAAFGALFALEANARTGDPFTREYLPVAEGKLWMITFLIFGQSIFLTFLFDAWETLEPFRGRLTREKAVWAFFLPLYNLYHLWIATVSLTDELNRIHAENGHSGKPLSRFPAIAFFISVLLVFIPGVVALTLVIQIYFVLKIARSANQLPATSQPIGLSPPVLRWHWLLVPALLLADQGSSVGVSYFLFGWPEDLGPLIGLSAVSCGILSLVFWPFMRPLFSVGSLTRIVLLYAGWFLIAAATYAMFYKLLASVRTMDDGPGIWGKWLNIYPLNRALLFAVLLKFTLRLPLTLTLGALLVEGYGSRVIIALLRPEGLELGTPEYVQARLIITSITAVFGALVFLFPIYLGSRRARWMAWDRAREAEAKALAEAEAARATLPEWARR